MQLVLYSMHCTLRTHQQCILEILSRPEDRTQVSLLYANKTPADILLHSELDALAAKHSNFRVHFKVSDPDDGWQVRNQRFQY
jgi:cytochrome-b5 reductase